MITNSNRRAYAAVAIVILLSTVFAPQPGNPGVWLREVFEWLHVPVFGLVSLAILSMTPTSWRRSQRFGLALLGSIILGVLTEVVQIPMQRDASWEDLISDTAGAAGFLLFAYAIDRKPIVGVVSAIFATAILLWSATPLITVTQALVHRNSQFPVIFNGDIDAEQAFVSGRNIQMKTQQPVTGDGPYTKIQVFRDTGMRIEIRDLVPDWSSYSNLNLRIEVLGDLDLNLTVRIHDTLHRRGDQPHNDRFNQKLTLSPGMNSLTIPLQDVRSAPHGRSMDMTKIEALILFSGKSDAARSFNLFEINLSYRAPLPHKTTSTVCKTIMRSSKNV
jgi:VanZ family protein